MADTTRPDATRSGRPRHLDLDGLLADRATKVLVCCGSGGVGKTTTAASLALRAAEGALANDVHPVGVLWGYGDRAELEAAGVRDLVAEPVELIPIHAAFQARLRAAAS